MEQPARSHYRRETMTAGAWRNNFWLFLAGAGIYVPSMTNRLVMRI
jgi:hypothetical protein